MKKYLLSYLAFFIINFIIAQPRFEAGYHYTSIHQNKLKGKIEPYHNFAAAIIVFTHQHTKSKLAPVTGIEFIKNGYSQIIEENVYTNSFTYLYLPVGISYYFVDFLSISAGISGGIRLQGRHIINNTKYRLPKDFHNTELSFFSGININRKQRHRNFYEIPSKHTTNFEIF